MLKILKNLKESWIQVILIIVLLCIQAATDLKLPSYTSNIVNVGIQQGGIENSVPEYIRETQLNNLFIFTNESDKAKILSSYSELDKTDENLKEIPTLKDTKIFKLNNLSKQDLEELDTIVSKPMMYLGLLENEEISNKIKENLLQNNTNVANYNTQNEDNDKIQQAKNESSLNALNEQLMQSASVIEVLKMMPKEQRDVLINSLQEKLGQMGGTLIKQGAIAEVKKEYQAIGIDTGKISNKYIAKTGLSMLGIALISMVCAVLIMMFSSRVAAKFGKTMRLKVFDKILSFSNAEFNQFSTASLITRSTNDIQQVQQLLSILFRTVFYAPIMAVGGILLIIKTSNLSMTWIIALAVALIVATVLILFIVAVPKFKKMQSLIDNLNLVSREILTGIPVIRAFNTQKREEDRFDHANIELKKNSIFVNNTMSIMFPMMQFIMQSILLLVIWTGGHEIDSGIIQVGDMMAFIQYTMQILFSFLVISMLSVMLPRAQVSAKRINEVLDTDVSIKDLPKEKQKAFDENKKGYVEFKNVSFQYPDGESEVISDINFVAKPGETTAIIGSTGSGKSSIVNLIPRFFDVTSGEILVDGVNIKKVPQKELHKRIGFVPQKGVLFSGTIASNIKYGKDISDDEMKKVAQIAQATEFIEKKPDKYDDNIAQGGNNVSGGQKQRLSIARALAMNPEIFIFDDSFSALDLKTDRKLREELKPYTKDKTVIIVAQRVGTIMDADQILVVEDGKLIGKGTHEELLHNCETYKQIAMSQLTEEELKLNDNGDTSEKTGKSVNSLENKENYKGNEDKKDIENKLNEIKKEGGEN